MDPLKAERFLNACRREPVDCTPVWLMRQAGRYMAEYRALRERGGILDLIRDPAVACEVTMQPIQAFDVDAAIIFADILPLLQGMGFELEFVPGRGPVIHNPLREEAQVEALRPVEPETDLCFTLEAIKLVLAELDGRIPLIGFSGAPFTLACYAIEGGGSKEFLGARRMMLQAPVAFKTFMDRLTTAVADYLVAQVKIGVQAVQLFDSWAGVLGPSDYAEWVLPAARRIIGAVKDENPNVQVIHFATGSAGILELVRDAGCDVVGVDWRIDLVDAWDRIGDDHAVQGNLDPVRLLGPREPLLAETARILDSVEGRPGHIFNLGHGIHKETDPDNVAALIDFVHSHSRVDS